MRVHSGRKHSLPKYFPHFRFQLGFVCYPSPIPVSGTNLPEQPPSVSSDMLSSHRPQQLVGMDSLVIVKDFRGHHQKRAKCQVLQKERFFSVKLLSSSGFFLQTKPNPKVKVKIIKLGELMTNRCQRRNK